MMQAAAVADAPAAPQAPAPPTLPYRVGHGFDLHRLAEGYKLIIGGVEIPHTKGCEAHSDGDVLLHTVTDAILGALSLPDIGACAPSVWRAGGGPGGGGGGCFERAQCGCCCQHRRTWRDGADRWACSYELCRPAVP
jgi:hypothetical protein